VRVPDECRIGDIDGGWGVMRVALVYERGLAQPSAGPTWAERAAAWGRAARRDAGSAVLTGDPGVGHGSGDGSGEDFPAAVEDAFRKSVVTTIYGGTSEIMREIIAERHLGLPRARPA
jgi:3-oxocholest-4-en-26-oyl-CoA dehydrogenase alpha subunit